VLRPIIERLREQGHEVVVTSRDYTQTQELLALHSVEHPTLVEAWRAREPHTPQARKRIEAVAELTRAGIRRSCSSRRSCVRVGTLNPY
jgi:predicted glycosyltransferase